MSTWEFRCQLGLAQGTCQAYERDDKARGIQHKLGGCATCKNRAPANDATLQAESNFAWQQREEQDV